MAVNAIQMWKPQPDGTCNPVAWPDIGVGEETKSGGTVINVGEKTFMLIVPDAGYIFGDHALVDRGYDRGQRAFVVGCLAKADSGLQIKVAASEDNPVYNPAFVLLGWGAAGASLEIDGETLERGEQFRYGHRHGLDSSDLILWIEHEATRPFEINLQPAG